MSKVKFKRPSWLDVNAYLRLCCWHTPVAKFLQCCDYREFSSLTNICANIADTDKTAPRSSLIRVYNIGFSANNFYKVLQIRKAACLNSKVGWMDG